MCTSEHNFFEFWLTLYTWNNSFKELKVNLQGNPVKKQVGMKELGLLDDNNNMDLPCYYYFPLLGFSSERERNTQPALPSEYAQVGAP